MKNSILRVLLLCALSFFSLQVNAAIINLAADLNSSNEVPPVTVPDALGSAAMVLDSDTGDFGWVISFEGLTGSATAAHFHVGAIDEAGPVIFDLDTGSGVQFSGISQANGIFTGSTTLGATEISDILQGLWYINIHTEDYPGGEIRGQVLGGTFTPIPLPAAIWLFISALSLLGFVWRPKA
ncbi:MAG: CHRD domain-containing protein [Methylococcales bacterium]